MRASYSENLYETLRWELAKRFVYESYVLNASTTKAKSLRLDRLMKYMRRCNTGR